MVRHTRGFFGNHWHVFEVQRHRVLLFLKNISGACSFLSLVSHFSSFTVHPIRQQSQTVNYIQLFRSPRDARGVAALDRKGMTAEKGRVQLQEERSLLREQISSQKQQMER
jgi:hypothetical protein